MPKLKSHSGAKKRFKVTSNGKVKANCTSRGHFLTEKRPSRKRRLRKGTYIQGKQAANIKKLIQS